MNDIYRNRPERAEHEQRERPEKGQLSRDLVESLFLESRAVDGGQDGVIFRLDMRSVDAGHRNVLEEYGMGVEHDSAVKMLKVYKPGTALKEFSALQEAHRLLSSRPGRARKICRANKVVHGPWSTWKLIGYANTWY